MLANGATSEELDNPGPLIEMLKQQLKQQREQFDRDIPSFLRASSPSAPEPAGAAESSSAPEPESTNPFPNIINLESSAEEFASDLNSSLSRDTNHSRLTFSVPVETIKGHLTKAAMSGGNSRLDKEGILSYEQDSIIVTGLKIHASKNGIEKDLTLNFHLVNSGSSIETVIGPIDGLGRIMPGKTENMVREEFAKMATTFRGKLKDAIPENPDWEPDNINIRGNRILIGFSRIPSQTT